MEILFLLVMYLIDSNNVSYNYSCYGFNSLANNHIERYTRMLVVFLEDTSKHILVKSGLRKYYGKPLKVAITIVINSNS